MQKLRTILFQSCPINYIVILVGSTALIGSLISAIIITGEPGYIFTDDPAALTKQPFYLGAFAHIGIIFWCAASTICLFCLALLKGIANKAQEKRFMLSSGLLTIFLLLDDLFLLHEEVLPENFGIPEKLVYLTYAVIVAVYLVKFSKFIFNTQFIPLFLAFGLFAISILNDQLTFFAEYSKDLHTLVEDGSKLLGIFCWLIYFAGVGLEKLRANNFSQTEYRQKALR